MLLYDWPLYIAVLVDVLHDNDMLQRDLFARVLHVQAPAVHEVDRARAAVLQTVAGYIAEIDMLLGALYEEAGEYPMALVAYRRAGRSGGSRKSLESIARVSALSGDAAGALITYRRLCRADGGVGDACRTAEKLSAGELP